MQRRLKKEDKNGIRPKVTTIFAFLGFFGTLGTNRNLLAFFRFYRNLLNFPYFIYVGRYLFPNRCTTFTK